ncbi:MAG TPA: hypothetical protein VKB32_12215, partial [Actinomycetota bacterium]|nr:hypothetical protein [Actinomycetota bacterium]
YLVEIVSHVLREEGSNMPGIPLKLAVGDSPFLKCPEARHPVVRLPEDSLPEQSHGDEQQG